LVSFWYIHPLSQWMVFVRQCERCAQTRYLVTPGNFGYLTLWTRKLNNIPTDACVHTTTTSLLCRAFIIIIAALQGTEFSFLDIISSVFLRIYLSNLA
jgi:hypothetical protein